MRSILKFLLLVMLAIAIVAFSLGVKQGKERKEEPGTDWEKYVRYRQKGDYERALPYAKRICETVKAKHGRDSRQYGIAANNLATLYWGLGDAESAIPLHEEALALLEKHFGVDHKETDLVKYELGYFLMECNDFRESEKHLKEVIERRRKNLGEKHEMVAIACNTLGQVYYMTDEPEKSAPLLEEAVEILKAEYGTDHPETWVPLTNLGQTYCEMGRYAEAEEILLPLLSNLKEKYSETHPHTLDAMCGLGRTYMLKGDYEKGEQWLLKALKLGRESVGTKTGSVGAVLVYLARLHQLSGQDEQMDATLSDLVDVMKETPITEPRAIEDMTKLSAYFVAHKNYEGAEILALLSFRFAKDEYGDYHPLMLKTMLAIAHLDAARGTDPELEETYKTVLHYRLLLYPDGHPCVIESFDRLENLYRDTGKKAKADVIQKRKEEYLKRVKAAEEK